MPAGKLTINQEIQTDVRSKDLVVKTDIQPVFADVETISFYHMTLDERMEHFKMLLNDGYSYKNIKAMYDPCIDMANYSREAEPVQPRDILKPRSNSASNSKAPMSVHQIPIEKHLEPLAKSPSLFNNNYEYSQSNSTSKVSPRRPLNQPVITSSESPPRRHLAKSLTSSILGRSASPSSNYFSETKVNYRQDRTSEKTNADFYYERTSNSNASPAVTTTATAADSPVSQAPPPPLTKYGNKSDESSSFVTFSRSCERSESNNNQHQRNRVKSSTSGKMPLTHSTIELTSVMNDRTVVTGIPIKEMPNDDFSVHVNNDALAANNNNFKNINANHGKTGSISSPNSKRSRLNYK